MPMSIKPGLGAAIEALSEAHTLSREDPGSAERGDSGGGRQLGFFVAPADDETKAAEIELVARGPGKPAGSQNKRTGALKAYILGLRDRHGQPYKHPAIVLATFASADPKELARELSIKVAEAAEIVRKSAVDLMPYFESKMPVAIDLGDADADRPMIIIGTMRAGARSGAPGLMGLDDDVDEMAETGHSGDDGDGVSHGGKSHDAP